MENESNDEVCSNLEDEQDDWNKFEKKVNCVFRNYNTLSKSEAAKRSTLLLNNIADDRYLDLYNHTIFFLKGDNVVVPLFQNTFFENDLVTVNVDKKFVKEHANHLSMDRYKAFKKLISNKYYPDEEDAITEDSDERFGLLRQKKLSSRCDSLSIAGDIVPDISQITKCRHIDVITSTKQTRSADEMVTIIQTCKACGYVVKMS